MIGLQRFPMSIGKQTVVPNWKTCIYVDAAVMQFHDISTFPNGKQKHGHGSS